MQRSLSRKLARLARQSSVRPPEQRFAKFVRHASIGAAVMAAISAARAQQPPPSILSAATVQSQQAYAAIANPSAASTPAQQAEASRSDQSDQLQEVVVTATKRSESMQNIPITITAITSAALENQNIQNFNDYALALPQVSFTNDSPGSEQIFMRGIGATGAGSTTGTNQTVGVYLDDQPITTPNGALDLHMYDIARVEVLPGPQGTLYGAASESGTLRIITTKPDPSGFHAGYTAQLNTIYNGTLGDIFEGFVNAPITSNLAVRLVGWHEHDSGYLNNVHQRITLNNGFTLDNAPYVEKHFNPVTTDGGRAALKFDINDNWSISPTLITQNIRYDGSFGQEHWKDLAAGNAIPGNYSVAKFAKPTGSDSIVDRVLTVLGKIGNFDLTYAGSYMTRSTYAFSDYVDYTVAYPQYYNVWPTNPTAYSSNYDRYQTYSNELRIASPSHYPVRFVAGVFQERQENLDVYQVIIPGLNPLLWPGYGMPNVWKNDEYLTYQQRVDRDWAAFGEANWDITSQLTATVGFRRFRFKNSLEGFNGFGLFALGTSPPPLGSNGLPGPGGIDGQQTCLTTTPFHQAPCLNFGGVSEGWGSTPKYNISYKFDPDRLVYATYSRGFRAGGVNQHSGAPQFGADYLTNYELGWKTAWFDRHLFFNGAVYYETWKNFQFTYLAPHGLPLIANAGDSEVKGAEANVQWLVTRGLNLSASVAYNDSYLTTNYCGVLGDNGKAITSNPCIVSGQAPFTPLAPKGTRLPYTPLFKTNLTARYSFPLISYTAFVEGDEVYQSAVWPALRTADNNALGQEPAYGVTNASLGINKNRYEIKLLVTNAFNRVASQNRFAEVLAAQAGVATYNRIIPPRLIGLQFSQQF